MSFCISVSFASVYLQAIGCSNSSLGRILVLRICAVSFVLKTLAFILAGNTWQLMGAFLLQSPSYALYMSAIVAYAKEKIGFEDSAKAQSIAFTTTTLGGMLASLIGGMLYDAFSVTTTLWIALGVGAVGAFIMFIGTRRSKIQTKS